MLELNKIYNMDCLDGMKDIPDGSIDCVVCDLPYGTMTTFGKGTELYNSEKHSWDVVIPTDLLFAQYERVLRRGGVAVLFSQEPYTSHLRTYKGTNFLFKYPMIWVKNSPGHALNAHNAPMNYFEDLNIFVKREDCDYKKEHPLRHYAKMICDYIGKNAVDIQKDFTKNGIEKTTRASHFLAYNSLQFYLCTKETYDLLIKTYHIDKMSGFREFDDLYLEELEFRKNGRKIFNLPDGCKSISNVLKFSKDKNKLHPTQKPVDLIRYLISIYTNEGDTVLDNCMGSGTTAIACINENRNFIGFELDENYFKIAEQRINEALNKKKMELF